MDPSSFQSHMRLTREQFNCFVDQLKRSGLSDDQQPGGPARPPVVQKAHVFLWYMGNQNSIFPVEQLIIMSLRFWMLPARLLTCTDCDKRVISAVFCRLCGIRGIIGAIDGCHIHIQRPVVRGGDYLNRKGFYSLLLKGIVNDQGRFLDIFIGVHDSRMLRASTFFET